MTESTQPEVGTIGWFDLTVEDAESVRDFYSAVVGWDATSVDMGGYSDFNMISPGSPDPVAGICHARKGNSDLPPTWLIYITVEDVDVSAETCRHRGGEILVPPRDMGDMGRFCVIQDPAGAVSALFGYKK